ncbi:MULTISPECIES: flavin reductase family protein [Amycolatopsis]|uniref:Flavin reductase family protein n=1 Tax=Amycolatopsis thermalba TaxID=944492 RepID=A0ABY4NWS3_9PSEU|nr:MULTISPECIES: flavin reductase family protein [Amycolatopsis]OXM64294.1 oxidoreductase [Amycolatopsis sp. KNN50.9b]UQS24496.1 flavin reductase family protein [Amycolatopsis thermalba]
MQADVVRQLHRTFTTGVTVVTTLDDGRPRGLAVNAFCSVSLDPPTVLVCVQKSSTTHGALLRAGHFAVNILAADQADVVAVFASKAADKFATLSWRPGPHGSPLLDGVAAAAEAEVTERRDAGSHTVFFGRVVEAAATDAPALVYRAGRLFDPSGLVPIPA